MNVTATDSAERSRYAGGWVNKIPVSNIWLLMVYASESREAINRSEVLLDRNPDELVDVIAELLHGKVQTRLRRNLTPGYVRRNDELCRLRGRLDLLSTERKRLLAKGKVACSYEELTVDTPRNRMIRFALDQVSLRVSNKQLATDCRSLAAQFNHLGVSAVPPSQSEISTDSFGRHDAGDREVVALARLALTMCIPTEQSGHNLITDPDKADRWVRELFEKAVAGYYKVMLPSLGWSIKHHERLNWPRADQTTGFQALLPGMETDITLRHRGAGRMIVIDTKFTGATTTDMYGSERFKSGYLYQLYTYLRTQEEQNDLARSASGVLLHPSIDELIDEAAFVQGHVMRVATVDLNMSAKRIRDQIRDVVLKDELLRHQLRDE